MTVLALLDAIDDCPEAAAETARALVEVMLIEVGALKKLDALTYPANPDDAARRRSRRIFTAWRRWIGEAEALLDQVAGIRPTGELSKNARALDREVAEANLRMKMALESVQEGRDQARRGEVVPAEEVRRELQLRLDKKRSA